VYSNTREGKSLKARERKTRADSTAHESDLKMEVRMRVLMSMWRSVHAWKPCMKTRRREAMLVKKQYRKSVAYRVPCRN
jgi:hypothetical protein